jgi:hypothetical protein
LSISGIKPVEEKAGKAGSVTKTRRIGWEDKILKYNLKPIMNGLGLQQKELSDAESYGSRL